MNSKLRIPLCWKVLDLEGDYAALVPKMRRILAAMARFSPGTDDQRADAVLLVEHAHSLLGDALYYRGATIPALDEYRAALDVLGQSLARQPDARMLYRQAFEAFNEAALLAELKRPQEALSTIETGIAAAARLRDFENSPRARHVEAIVTMEYAKELQGVGRTREAVAMAERSMAERRERERLQPGNFEAMRAVPVGMRPLAEIYWAAGRRADACRALHEAQVDWARLAAVGKLAGADAVDEVKTVASTVARYRCRPDPAIAARS